MLDTFDLGLVDHKAGSRKNMPKVLVWQIGILKSWHKIGNGKGVKAQCEDV